jgi:ABC-type long-subunit fatty acid transport system fused permease/ATPase subunit
VCFAHRAGAFNLWIGTFDCFMNAMPIFLLAPAIFANEYSLNRYIQAMDAFRLVPSCLHARTSPCVSP